LAFRKVEVLDKGWTALGWKPNFASDTHLTSTSGRCEKLRLGDDLLHSLAVLERALAIE
jgi:hypothetical protein